MFDLNNFKTLNLAPGFPSISITRNGVTFSKNAIIKLEQTEYVNLLVDEEEKVIAVKPCEKGDDKAIAFFRSGKKNFSVRWNFKDFLETLEALMDWNLEEQGFKIKGIYDREQRALFFDLNTAIYLDKEGKD